MQADILLPLVLDLLLKDTFVLIFTLLLFRLWTGFSAAQRCMIWSLAFAVIIVLPATRWIIPHWSFSPLATSPVLVASSQPLPVAAALTIVETTSAPLPTPSRWPTLSTTDLVVGLWISGGLLLIAYRLMGTYLLHRIYRRSQCIQDANLEALASSIAVEYDLSRSIDIRLSADCYAPVTWGTLRPAILLPSMAYDWPHERLETVLRHEMGHIKRFDHLTRWIVFLTCAFYWPNPLIWFAAKQFQIAQEEASDDLVLQVGIPAQEYAAQLIEIIRSAASRKVLSLPGISMAHPSTLEGRLSAILDEKRNRNPHGPRLLVGGFLLAGLLMTASALAQLRADAPPLPPDNQAPTVSVQVVKVDQAQQAKTEEKLNLIIPKIELDQATIEKACEVLAQASKDADPDHQGVNFKLPSVVPRAAISLKLDNVPLKMILSFMTMQANLQYTVINSDVCLSPVSAVPPPPQLYLVSRHFTVPDGFLGLGPNSSGPDVIHAFEPKGIKFTSPGATAVYTPATHDLVVVNTENQIELIRVLLNGASASNSAPVQVTQPEASPSAQTESPLAAKLEDKASHLVIPQVKLDNATVEEALQFLSEESIKVDPEGRGVRFIVAPPPPVARVSMMLSNVPLKEVLGYLSEQAKLRCTYNDYAIYVQSQASLPGGDVPPPPAKPEFSARGKITDKLVHLIIPNVDLKDATVDQALQFLAQASQQADPDHQGISFVLAQSTPKATVYLQNNNLSVMAVLNYIAQQANLEFMIKEDGVYVWSRTQMPVPSAWAVEAFTVDPGFVGKPNPTNDDIVQALQQKGIAFASGSSVSYFPEKNTLIVKNTPEQIGLINAVLKSIMQQPAAPK